MESNVYLFPLTGVRTRRSSPKVDTPTTTLSFDEAWHIIGGLSEPSKMPCFSYGLPPEACKTGSLLRAKVPDSTCARCYSFRGRATFPGVKDARARRLQSLTDPRWVEAMTLAIRMVTSIAVPYFRWHDSGDIQSDEHFVNICAVAQNLPQIQFWLPTQEHRYAREWIIPDNLIVRASAALLGGSPPEAPLVSSVVPKTLTAHWPDFVSRNTKVLFRCLAGLDKKYYNCGDCRACWDPEVYHVQYLES
jgi:hypothetical protein